MGAKHGSPTGKTGGVSSFQSGESKQERERKEDQRKGLIKHVAGGREQLKTSLYLQTKKDKSQG